MLGVALFDDGPDAGIGVSPERSCVAGWHGMALPGGAEASLQLAGWFRQS